MLELSIGEIEMVGGGYMTENECIGAFTVGGGFIGGGIGFFFAGVGAVGGAGLGLGFGGGIGLMACGRLTQH